MSQIKRISKKKNLTRIKNYSGLVVDMGVDLLPGDGALVCCETTTSSTVGTP